jgi:hypothetical protein
MCRFASGDSFSIPSNTYFNMTDKRDAIYRILSLAADIKASGWEANYSISYLNVYKDIVKKNINISSSLDIVCHAGSCWHYRQPTLTWVPRFDNEIWYQSKD